MADRGTHLLAGEFWPLGLLFSSEYTYTPLAVFDYGEHLLQPDFGGSAPPPPTTGQLWPRGTA